MLPIIRRKFRSQTSDNMGRWKSRGGKSQRGEEQKREDQRRERVRRKKMQVREKVGKSRNTAFFQWFVAQEGRKVGSLKRRVRSHVVRWERKSCTPLWRETHFQVKCTKHTNVGTLLEVEMSKKAHAVVARSTFQSHYTTLTTTTATAPTTLHYTSRQWQRQRQLHLHLQRHYSTLRYSPLHYTTLHSTPLHHTRPHHTTLHYTRLDYTTAHHTTAHYTTLHCTTLITPHHNYNCHCATLITLQLQLHYVRWPLQPLQPFQKTQLQPLFGPSVDSFCHPCITTTHLSCRPRPCAVLLVWWWLLFICASILVVYLSQLSDNPGSFMELPQNVVFLHVWPDMSCLLRKSSWFGDLRP